MGFSKNGVLVEQWIHGYPTFGHVFPSHLLFDQYIDYDYDIS